MAFSLGQFLAAPVLGEFADRFGRRRVLVITVFCTMIGLIITAWSMDRLFLFGLFLGRLTTGIFSSNGSICLACVSDISKTAREKITNFGHFSSLAGFSFVIGAFVGGKLSDSTITPFFDPALPLWIASAITALNFLFVLFAFKEVKRSENPRRLSFLSSFQNMLEIKKTKQLLSIYTIYFFFIFSWTILLQFTPVIVIKHFSFTSSNIGDLALFVGILWALGSTYLKEALVSYFSSSKTFKLSLLLLSILATYLIFPKEIYLILLILGLSVLFGGVIWPLCTAAISNLAPSAMQGKILGISQSVQSFAMTLSPVVAGLAFKYSIYLPFYLAALIFLFAALISFQKIQKI